MPVSINISPLTGLESLNLIREGENETLHTPENTTIAFAGQGEKRRDALGGYRVLVIAIEYMIGQTYWIVLMLLANSWNVLSVVPTGLIRV